MKRGLGFLHDLNLITWIKGNRLSVIN
jgi:hypothetical protein